MKIITALGFVFWVVGFRPMFGQTAPNSQTRYDQFFQEARAYQLARDTPALARLYENWVAAAQSAESHQRLFAHDQRAEFRASIGDYRGEAADLQLLAAYHLQRDCACFVYCKNRIQHIYIRQIINAYNQKDSGRLDTLCWRFAQVNGDTWPAEAYLDWLERWKRAPDPRPVFWVASARLHLNQSEENQSVAAAQRALLDLDTARTRGFDPPALDLLRAEALYRAKKPEEALELVGDFIEHYPDWPEAHALLIWMRQHSGKRVDASYRDKILRQIPQGCRERLDRMQR